MAIKRKQGKLIEYEGYLVEYLKLLRRIFGGQDEADNAFKSFGLTKEFLYRGIEQDLGEELKGEFLKILLMENYKTSQSYIRKTMPNFA